MDVQKKPEPEESTIRALLKRHGFELERFEGYEWRTDSDGTHWRVIDPLTGSCPIVSRDLISIKRSIGEVKWNPLSSWDRLGNTAWGAVLDGRVVGIVYWVSPDFYEDRPAEERPRPGWCLTYVDRPEDPTKLGIDWFELAGDARDVASQEIWEHNRADWERDWASTGPPKYGISYPVDETLLPLQGEAS